MKKTEFTAVAALALWSVAAFAGPQSATQSTAPQTPHAAIAKPSPYEGVSQPPATDVIRTTEEQPAVAPAMPAPVAVVAPVPAARAAAAPKPDPNGIVEVPVPDEDATPAVAASTPSPTLQTRQVFNPDANIVSSVPTPDNELPEGTPVHAKLDQEISSRENGVGTPFSAQVSQDVMQNGRVIIPVGSLIHGRVTHADYGRRIAGPASLRLNPEEVVLPDGTRYTFHGIVSQTGRASNTKVVGEGTVESKDHAKRIAAEYGIGAGGGAVAGAAVAGPTGAIVGTAIGLGVVTAHWLRENHAAVLPANSDITFGLTQPMMLTPATPVTTARE